MALELKPVAINRDDIARLDSILKSYTRYYISDDIKIIVLIAEGFGSESIEFYLHRVSRALERVVLQNPLGGLYLPFLSALGLRSADRLMTKLGEYVNELRKWVKESKHSIERSILSERRSNLVSLALASKYFLDVLDREEYHSFVDFYVNTLLTDTILSEITRRYYDDLDVVEKTSLLYLYEIVNLIREKLGLPPLDTSPVKNYLENLIKTKPETFIRLAVASLLYELSKLRRNKQYLLYFYEVLSDIDFRALASEIRRREEESIKELSIYDLDEESIKVLSIPLGDVELMLTAKLINLLQKEFIHIPLIGFADFISSYYGIPKPILKLWLLLRITYYRVLKYLGYVLIIFISIIISLFIQRYIVAPLLSIISIITVDVMKRLQQIAELKIVRYFKRVREHADEKIEKLKYKKRFLNYFVP